MKEIKRLKDDRQERAKIDLIAYTALNTAIQNPNAENTVAQFLQCIAEKNRTLVTIMEQVLTTKENKVNKLSLIYQIIGIAIAYTKP